jgi:hypothetical protein
MTPRQAEGVVDKQEHYYRLRLKQMEDRSESRDDTLPRRTTHPDRLREIHDLEDRLPLRRRGHFDPILPETEATGI